MKTFATRTESLHLGRSVSASPLKKRSPFSLLPLITILLTLAGCGGGAGGGASSQVVSGTAAVGSPLAGQVVLKDSSTPAREKSALLGSDGSFTIDVSDLKAPFVLQASGSAGGAQYKVHSFAAGSGTANVNPLSDVIVASAAGVQDPSAVFDNATPDQNEKIAANIDGTATTLLAKLQPLLKAYGADNTNPITAQYTANHLGLDGMFDNVNITVSNGALSISMAQTGAVVLSGTVNNLANCVFNSAALPAASSAPAPTTPAPTTPAPTTPAPTTPAPTPTPATPTVPAAPAGVTATGGANQVSLSWSAVSGATSYNVYWSTASGVTTTSGTKIAGATTPYLQTALSAGTAYYYVVTAVNSAGESAASAQVSATTAAAFDALAYYNSVCLGCHGSLGPRTAAQISAAITGVRSMKYLSTLTSAQVAAIAAVSY